MNNPLISVIVPVYNTEQYLHRCIDSILSQTYTNFELLLIDDGSSDGSGNICDKYAEKDPRVRVFHKENGGVSSARNLGLDNANGEWVTFVDSDDWISEDYFSNVELCTEDIVLLPYKEVGFDGAILNLVEIKRVNKFRAQALSLFLEKELVSTWFNVPWAKLYKKKVINDLRFDCRMKTGEDRCFNLELVYRLCSIEIRPCGCYFYYSVGDFFYKYKMSIKDAVYNLKKLYAVYDRLNIKTSLNRKIFVCYAKLCEKELINNPEVWLNDPEISQIYKDNKKSFLFKERVKYFLFRNQFVFKLLRRFFTDLHPI